MITIFGLILFGIGFVCCFLCSYIEDWFANMLPKMRIWMPVILASSFMLLGLLVILEFLPPVIDTIFCILQIS